MYVVIASDLFAQLVETVYGELYAEGHPDAQTNWAHLTPVQQAGFGQTVWDALDGFRRGDYGAFGTPVGMRVHVLAARLLGRDWTYINQNGMQLNASRPEVPNEQLSGYIPEGPARTRR